MMRRFKLEKYLPFLLGFLLLSAGCAVDGGSPEATRSPAPPQQSAARLGLAAPLRPFHDELEPYGDWVLIEPQGWVFRPRVNTVAWRPYQDGHWEPSYTYGWLWESNEPFGWITDHYGFWFHDEFQGWVWQPYGAWAPSWVAWVEVGDFVGWAPLAPASVTNFDQVPGGMFTFMSTRALANPSAGARASFVNDIPDDPRGVHPIDRIASLHGVYWNAGPDPEAILGVGTADRMRMDERDGRVVLPSPPIKLAATAEVDLRLLESRTTRAWSEARRELEAMRARRAGVSGGATRPPAREPIRSEPTTPRFKRGSAPVDTLADSTATDSLKRVKRAAKPGVPRPPRREPR